MRYVFLLCALLLPIQAWSATPDQLRDEAAQLMQKSRGNGKELAADLMLARAKVEAALSVLEAKPKLSEADENLQTELTSMKYWIRKMTILEDVDPESKRAVVASNGPSNPPAGGGSSTAVAGAKKSDELDPELAKAIAAARANPPKAPPKLKGTSSKYKDLPHCLEKIADDIKERYDAEKTGKLNYLRDCQREYFKRDFLSIVTLNKKRSDTLQAAALLFEAVDKFNIGVNGESLITTRLQACLELDRLLNTTPKAMTESERAALIKGFTTLAMGPYDFEPARKEFEAGMAVSKHPLFKLGKLLSDFGCLYTATQVNAAHPEYMRVGREVITPLLGPQVGKLWLDNFNKYRNWTLPKLKAEAEKLSESARDLAKENPSYDIYAAYLDAWSVSVFKETVESGEANRRALVLFNKFQERDGTDAEQTAVRVIIDEWMKHNKLIDVTVKE